MPFAFDLKTQRGMTDNPLVTCACGRETNADMMRDVRPVKALLGLSADYVCDSCVEHFHRTGIMSRSAYYIAHAAPADLVAIHTARDAAIKVRKNAI